MYRISTYLIILALVVGSVKGEECPDDPGQSPDDYPAEPNDPYSGWSYPAHEPKPADGSVLETTWVTLEWTPGFRSATITSPDTSPDRHCVYIGDSHENVSMGASTRFPVSQSETVFQVGDYLGELVKGKTYYWRVDEVFADNSVIAGLTWQFTILGEKALAPNPADRAVSVSPEAELSWMAGVGANSHIVYFGDNPDDVDAGTNDTRAGPVEDAKFVPQIQELGKTYYWRVDELYDSEPQKGDIWSFTVANSIVIDDFESYNDIAPPDPASNRIFDKWKDGSGTMINGAIVGNDQPPYAEQIIVHSGDQSMPYSYDNYLKTSRARRELVYPTDWTAYGITKLSLWFRGASANAADRMFVALGNAIVYHPDLAVTQVTGWNEWIIDLQAFAGDMNLDNVNTISIGLGDENNTSNGGSGIMFFDDIRLYADVSMPRVLYIYDDDIILAKSFQSLLEEYGCPTTLIRIDEVSAAALAACDLIVMGDDTEFIISSSIELISISDKPVVAVGEGGYQFIGKLELEIGWPHGTHGSDNSILVIDRHSSLFSKPRTINVPESHVLRLYSQTGHVGINLTLMPETVTAIGREVDSSYRYPLALEHDRYFLWGFRGSPENMTQIGKDLFINAVIYMANTLNCPLSDLLIVPEAKIRGELYSYQVAMSPDGGYVLVGDQHQEVITFATSEGSVLWKYPLPAGIEMEDAAISMDGNLIVVGGQGGSVFALSKTGALLWEEPEPKGEVNLAMTEAGDKIYADSYDTLYCYNASSDKLWENMVDLRNWSLWGISTTRTGDRILLRTNSDVILCDEGGNEIGFFDIVSGNHLVDADISEDGCQFVVNFSQEINGTKTYYVALYSIDHGEQWKQTVENYGGVRLDACGRVFCTTRWGSNYLWDNAGNLLDTWTGGGNSLDIDRIGSRCIVGQSFEATVYRVSTE